MRAIVAGGVTLSLVVISLMAAVALTDLAVLPSADGDEWRVLLRLAAWGCYVVMFLAGLFGAFLFLRRLF